MFRFHVENDSLSRSGRIGEITDTDWQQSNVPFASGGTRMRRVSHFEYETGVS